MKTKPCSKCGAEKPLDEFPKQSASKDGHRPDCKVCSSAWQREYRVSNRERKAAYLAEWRAANPDSDAEYRATLEGQSARWTADYRRRSRKFGFDPVIEQFNCDDVVSLYGDACAHCGGPFEQLDHFPVPVALGGAHRLENVRPSCVPCNTRRGAEARVARRIGIAA